MDALLKRTYRFPDSSSCCVFNSSLTVAQNNALKQNSNQPASKVVRQIMTAFGTTYASVNGAQFTLRNFPYPIRFSGQLQIDSDLVIENCQNILFDEAGMISLYKNGRTLTLKGSTLKSCGSKMWKGIYYATDGAMLVTMADSLGHRTQIWDADVGVQIAFANSNYHIDRTDFINNRLGILISQKPVGGSYIQRTRFYTDSLIAMKDTLNNQFSYRGAKPNRMLAGIYLNSVEGVNVGVRTECDFSRNYFRRCYYGIYSLGSSFTAVNNVFEGETDSVARNVLERAPYMRAGIAATGNIVPDTKTQAIVIGDNSTCGTNYFSGNRFGICLADNNTADSISILHNSFRHASQADVNILRAMNLGMIDIGYNEMRNSELCGDGIRSLGCANSGIQIHHNFVENVPIDSVYSTGHPFPKRACGIVVAGRSTNNAARQLSIHENLLSASIYGIYSLANKSPRIHHNSISTFQIPYRMAATYTVADTIHLFSDNMGIMSASDDDAQIVSNSINVLGVPGAFTQPDSLKNKVISVGVQSNKSATLVSCNTMTGGHWGVVGFGNNLGGVSIRNNQFENLWSGISIFGSDATIGNQGVGTCPTGTGNCTLSAAGDFTPDNRWVNNTYHLGIYASANASSQRILFREKGIPTGLSAQVNPLLPNFCGNPNAFNSSLNQNVFTNQMKFIGKCASYSNNAANGYLFSTCSDTAGMKDDLPKFWLAQISWWEKIALGLDTINNVILEPDIRKWRQTELMELLIADPQIRDSSAILDSFYLVRMNVDETMLRLKAIYEQAQKTSDSASLQSLYNENAAMYASSIQEQNMQVLNSIYLGYYNNYLGPTLIPDSIKLKLKNIASQCYVVGGPSVFFARALWWNVMNEVVWSFSDDCLFQTGYYKSAVLESKASVQKNKEHFKVYPNSLEASGKLYIESYSSGLLNLYNTFGQNIMSVDIMTGVNVVDLNGILKPPLKLR